MWAIILSDKVIELTDIDPEGRYHPSLISKSAPPHARVGMTYDNGGFYWVQESQEILESREKAWRDAELVRADEELNKVQDSDPKAKGTVSEWREYRKLLRGLPEATGFPNKESRPTSPDRK